MPNCYKGKNLYTFIYIEMKCLTGVRTYIKANDTDMATVLQRLENDCVVKKYQASNKQAKITDYFAC